MLYKKKKKNYVSIFDSVRGFDQHVEVQIHTHAKTIEHANIAWTE